ncbi:hypothetical protein [Solibacillus daqui]|uniref:hypothetical protein n=1 Tax=Solibacillus daqui TaxID=2912187 RepID=UPI002365B772|nr:hypothetical protein [Solibacillus daqui]
MRRYYENLKQHYHQNEWFSHIYLPVFHAFRVMDNYEMVPHPYYQLNEIQLASLMSQYLCKTHGKPQLITDLQRFNKTGALFSTQ